MENLNICAHQKLSFSLKNCASKPFGGQALPEPDGRAYSAPPQSAREKEPGGNIILFAVDKLRVK